MKAVKGMRWWMISLVTVGLIVNYLARNTLSVSAATIMEQLHVTTQQYSYVVVAWQVCYALVQPVAGYVLDALGTKIGFAIFAAAWSLACAATALATGWQSLALFRGILGVAEAAGIPGGVKASSEWFPAKERSVAIGWFNIGSSVGALLAPPLVVWAILRGSWEWAFVIVGVLGLVWTVLWLAFYKHPKQQKRLSAAERDYIVSGQEDQARRTAPRKKRAGKRSWSRAISGPLRFRAFFPSRHGRPSTPGFRSTWPPSGT